MIKKFKLYTKLLNNFINKDIVTTMEYGNSYSDISDTYNFWCDRMGKYVDNIISLNYIPNTDNSKIIDLACGTGYITKKMLSLGYKGYIEGIDISEKMIEKYSTINYNKLNFNCCDAIEFLKNKNEKVDAVFCGWALPYLDHDKFIKESYKKLNQNGIIAVISNCGGTLSGIEKIFLEVMEENLSEVIKPMDARIKLPKGPNQLKKWFSKYNLYPIKLGQGEEIVEYNSPEELYDWLVKTGVLAGTNKIFRDITKVENQIINKIEKYRKIDNKYMINHKFIYGVFRKEK